MAEKRSLVLRFLDATERIGNRLPDPITLFVIMAGLVVAVSALASWTGTSAVHPATGDTVTAVNLATGEGIRRMMTEAVRNFTAFPPLGLVIVVIIGIGVTERSGLIGVALRRLVSAVPPSFLTATIVFGGVMSSMAVDAGYVVLTPLGAMLFASVGRHPLAGLAAAFAGVSGGFSANLLLTSLDPLLSGLSTEAAQLVDPTYMVDPTANYYFMFASVFLLTGLGTFTTARYVEPRLGKWKQPEGLNLPEMESALAEVTPRERRGLRVAGIAFALTLVAIALLVVPQGAPLRAPEPADDTWMASVRPFMDSIVTLLMLLFLVTGIAYGVVAGTIKSDKDVARMSSDGVAVLGSYIVLAFAAAQFVAYFNWSNLGLILAIQGASGLQAVQAALGMEDTTGLAALPLLLAFIVVAAFINLFIGSASAKWAVMAPVFVPMLMLMGYSPEVVQLAYRIGDSTTNIITPLMQYFPVIIAFAQKYDPKTGIGTLISSMVPYSIVFMLGWLVMMTVWVLLELPVGPGAPLRYVAQGL
jgi:aminobenzoyl-glutamate transport protein